MRFKPEIKQVLLLYKLRSERRINKAELLASINRLFENIFLDGQVSQLHKILKEGSVRSAAPIYNDTPGEPHFIGTIDAPKQKGPYITKGDKL